MTEHEPQSSGIVAETGTFDADSAVDQRMRSIAVQIEDHGEVHANVQGHEKEVELRLGTTLVDYDTHEFKVWDGDYYQPISVGRINRVYKPMDVLH